MKLKKFVAGLTVAVMCSTGLMITHSSAEGGIFPAIGGNEQFRQMKMDVIKEDIVNNGQTVKVSDIMVSNIYGVVYSAERFFNIEKTGKAELEINGISQKLSLGLKVGYGGNVYYEADAITIDGKEYKSSDLKKSKEKDSLYGTYNLYSLDTISVKINTKVLDYKDIISNHFFYNIEIKDGKEHKIKLTYNNIEYGYYEVYVDHEEIKDKINKNTTIKFISSASASETLNKTTLKASSKNGKATLKWSAVAGAERYQIYVSTDGGKTYSRYKTYKSTVLKSTYTMTKGKTYKFKIRSYKTVDGKKVYSKWSNVKTIKY
ncbi:MAG: hypothetical protein IJ784_10190 [Ruminiclostridium sp.]|nr:hypothetical protein [Ruminiclostridium sp.]